jgi:Protein of unknown function (DUF1524).
MQPRWNKIVNTVSYRNFPTFLRYFINSREKLVRSERLFREIKLKITDKSKVVDVMDELEKYSDIYVAFDEPENELWQSNENIKRILYELSLFGVQQHKSLLLSTYFKINEHFESVLRIIRAITFRYNVIGKQNPNELERAYNNTAIRVFNGSITSPQIIQQELVSVYIDDESFTNIFSTKSFDTHKSKDKKIVRYILLSIENQKFNKDYHLFETNVTVEHIYPENYFNSGERIDDSMIYRLGNLTLLEPSLNRECGNKLFNQKMEIYLRSQYEITKEIAGNDDWNAQSIRTDRFSYRGLLLQFGDFHFRSYEKHFC